LGSRGAENVCGVETQNNWHEIMLIIHVLTGKSKSSGGDSDC